MSKTTTLYIAWSFPTTALPSLCFACLWAALLPINLIYGASPGVFVWWNVLCAVTGLNIWAWSRSVGNLAHFELEGRPAPSPFIRWQFLLCTAFVLGCAFRSVFPRGDVQRIGMFDTWLSSVFAGRCVATVAEICFAAQWALWLRQHGLVAGSRLVLAASWLVVPLILVAEWCSWYAVLTTAYIGNMVEESIWTIAAALVVISTVVLWRRCGAAGRATFAAVIMAGLAYVVFMCVVDVPMYAARWNLDEMNGRSYLTLEQGLWDTFWHWKVTRSWGEWCAEMPWMSLYFSVGVWSSIFLVHASRLASTPFRGEYQTNPARLAENRSE
jgi:hypothetical protein